MDEIRPVNDYLLIRNESLLTEKKLFSYFLIYSNILHYIQSGSFDLINYSKNKLKRWLNYIS